MANGNAFDAHYGCVLGHLINNSYRLGQKVPFNAQAGRFGDNQEAYEHFMKLHALMRDGVGVPEDSAEYVVGPWLTFDPQTERHVGEHADAANALLKDANTPGFRGPDAPVGLDVQGRRAATFLPWLGLRPLVSGGNKGADLGIVGNHP